MKEQIAHSGAWGIALIVIVVASWFLYRYLAPKTWKEWASAGVIQAFIIALYAEMYGFPLTIYLLVRFFGMDQTDLNANLWSTLLGFGETGMMISMILGYMLLVAGFGIFMEGWRELHRARQENRLVTDRLYGLVRHPQYTGLFIALFGEGIVHWPTIFSVALFPSSFSPIFCWREARSAKWCNSSVMNIALTRNACRCSSRAGVNGATWRQREPTPQTRVFQIPKKSKSKDSNNSQERNRTMKESKSVTKDPICGMTVDEAVALNAVRNGKTFYFGCEKCRQKFLSTPAGAEPQDKSGGCCG